VAAIPNLEGRVLTVSGPIDPSAMGVTLTHEHLFCDLRRTHLPHRRWVVRDDRLVAEVGSEDFPSTELLTWEAKLDLSNLHVARQMGAVADNYVLADEAVATNEVRAFKSAGGGTIVDVTSIGMKRDPRALRRVADATGVNIIQGTGWYQRVYHPDDASEVSVEALTDTIVGDVTRGVHDGLEQTDLRSGVIGEIGINGGPLITNERKSMRAAARASRITGAPVLIHLGGVGAEKHEMLDIIADEGVDLAHVIQGHSDDIADTALLRELLDRGVTVAFDCIGADRDAANRTTERVARAIPGLVADGYGDRIVLSHDVCWKVHLKAYGGTGFTYINDEFLPYLRTFGVSDDAIAGIMVRNPARAVTFTAPR
jgi:phosphotriesterase-related protein